MTLRACAYAAAIAAAAMPQVCEVRWQLSTNPAATRAPNREPPSPTAPRPEIPWRGLPRHNILSA